MKLDLANQTTLTYDNADFTAQSEDKTLEVVPNQEFKFTAAPAEGYELSTVEAVSADGTEHELAANESGEYTVTADLAADGLTLKTKAEEIPVQPAEEQKAEQPQASAGVEEKSAEYNVYTYTLAPGYQMDSGAEANKKWNGMGVGSITLDKSPQEYMSEGQEVVPESDWADKIKLPNSYPALNLNNDEYKYAVDGTENANKAGYYTIEWSRLVVAPGANAGANGYNEPVDSNTYTYHLDGVAKFNVTNKYAVIFKILEPGDSDFKILEEGYALYDEGTDLSKVTRPTNLPEHLGYHFDGWYTDEAMMNKATFDGILTNEMTFYGAYVPDEHTITYRAEEGGTVEPQNETVSNGKDADGSTAKPRDGYYFVNWTDENGAEVGTDPHFAPKNVKADAVYTAHFAKKYDVTVKANSATYVYDGTEHTVSGFENWDDGHEGAKVTADGQTYYVTGITSKATGTEVKDSVEEIPVLGEPKVEDGQGNDVTGRFDVAIEHGELKIRQREVDLAIPYQTKVYDGTKNLTDGDDLTVGPSEEQSRNDMGVVPSDVDKVTFTVSRGDMKYEQATVGENIPVKVEPEKVAVSGDAAGNYKVKSISGLGSITKRAITVYGELKTGYTGQEQWVKITPDEADGVVDGEVLDLKGTFIRGTDAGTYTTLDEGWTWSVFGENRKETTDNYTIKVTGKLIITKIDIADHVKLETKDAEKVYDGTPLEAGTAKASDDLGNDAKVEYSVDGETWTEDPSKITATDVADSTTIKVRASTKNYEGYVTGEQALTITKRPLDLIIDPLVKTYDGDTAIEEKPHLSANPNPKTGEGIVKGDDVDLRIRSKYVAYESPEVGEDIPLKADEEMFQTAIHGKDAGNYTVRSISGTGAIRKADPEDLDKSVSISNWRYNGFFDADHTLKSSAVSEKDGAKVEYVFQVRDGKNWKDINEKPVDAGEYRVVAVWPETHNYPELKAYKVFSIEKAPYTVTTGSDRKAYDGTPLTNGEYHIKGIIEGETFGFETTGEQTEVGTSENTYKITWAGKGNDYTAKKSNYILANGGEDLGTLEVYKADPNDVRKYVQIDSWTYDGYFDLKGTLQSKADSIKDGAEAEFTFYMKDANGDWIELNDEPVNVGEYKVKAYWPETHNYPELSAECDFSIDPRPVDVVIASQTKTYDGTTALASEPVLSAGPATSEDDGVVEGDDPSFTIAADAVQYASADVADGIQFVANAEDVKGANDDAANYTVRSVSGTGSITAASPNPEFALTATGYTGVYDGRSHDGVLGAAVRYTGKDKAASDLSGWKISYSLTENGTYSEKVPQVTNVSDSTTIYVKATNPNYEDMVMPVSAAVAPATITLTIENQTKTAGSADPALTSFYEGIVEGELAGWTGDLTREPGETAGTYAITLGTLALADNAETGFLAANYTLTVVPGTLTITAAPAGPGANPGVPAAPVAPGGGGVAGAGTTPAPTPVVAGAAAGAAAGEAIDDDATPLAAGETIDDDETPLASGREERDCWVHWLMFVGIAASAVYFVAALIRRRNFTSGLKDYEDSVLNPDNNQNRA